MSLELAKKEIDGALYEFQQFGAKKATKMLVRIGRIAGKPISIFGSQLAKGKDAVESLNSADMIAQIIGAFTEKLDENDVLDIIETFTAVDVLCDGKKIHSFDHHFQNRLDHMFRVLWAALEVQYGNFFGAITAILPVAPKPPVSNRDPQT